METSSRDVEFQPHKSTRLSAAALSDVGRSRSRNEDAVALLEAEGIVVVSDGMGGQASGDTASQIVVRVLPMMIRQAFRQSPPKSEIGWQGLLRDCICRLSEQLLAQSAGKPGLAGMGATVVLAMFVARDAYIANLGDSRAYLFRGRRLKQLTRDHSVAGILVRDGELSPSEARHHPARNQLSRYVGMLQTPDADSRRLRLQVDDRILLCTDGLTTMVSDRAIAGILQIASSPEAACRALVHAANRAGGKDNVTVVVIDWRGQSHGIDP